MMTSDWASLSTASQLTIVCFGLSIALLLVVVFMDIGQVIDVRVFLPRVTGILTYKAQLARYWRWDTFPVGDFHIVREYAKTKVIVVPSPQVSPLPAIICKAKFHSKEDKLLYILSKP